jgi:hypothetical protein
LLAGARIRTPGLDSGRAPPEKALRRPPAGLAAPDQGRQEHVGGLQMEQEVIEQGGHIGGVTFGAFLVDALFIFFFVVWFWILIRVLMDLFRRKDVSGVAKVLWVIFLVVLPYIGVFAYLLTQGWSMGERDVEQADLAREHLRGVVGFSVADELVKLDKLKADGAISDPEYQKLRAKLI